MPLASLEEVLELIGHYDAPHTRLVTQVVAGLDATLARDCDLWECCRHGEDCWRGAAARPQRMHYRAPYVGPKYLDRRILIVGMNSRDDGRFDSEFHATAEVLKCFRSGEPSYGGLFHYRVGLLVSLITAGQDGMA